MSNYWDDKDHTAVRNDLALPTVDTNGESVKRVPVYIQAKAQDGTVYTTANRDTGYTITLVRQSGDTALEYVRNDRKRTGVDTAFYNAKVETDGTYVLFLNNAASDPYADMRIQARDVQAKLRVRQIRDENGDPVTEDWSAYTTQGNREYQDAQAMRGVYEVEVVAENGNTAYYTVRITNKSGDATIGLLWTVMRPIPKRVPTSIGCLPPPSRMRTIWLVSMSLVMHPVWLPMWMIPSPVPVWLSILLCSSSPLITTLGSPAWCGPTRVRQRP